MSKVEGLMRYNAIVKRLRISPATRKEIEDYLEKESEILGYNLAVSTKTFKRDLDDIRSLYSVDIQYDFSRRVYTLQESLRDEVSSRMLEAFDTYNALNVSAGLAEYLDFERRRSLGLENFHGLLHAIKTKSQLHFDYKSFWSDKKSLRKTQPYLLKEFKNRWYLVAKDLEDDAIKTFALDRLGEIEITKKKFKNPVGFDPKEKFRNSFGIITPFEDDEPERVILSFTPEQGKYIKTLPLHHSQEVLIDDQTELRLQLKVYVVYDFIKEIVSHGANVKVIEPETLRNEVKGIHQEALELY